MVVYKDVLEVIRLIVLIVIVEVLKNRDNKLIQIIFLAMNLQKIEGKLSKQEKDIIDKIIEDRDHSE